MAIVAGAMQEYTKSSYNKSSFLRQLLSYLETSAETDLYFVSELLVVLFELSVFREHRRQRLLLRLKATNVVDRASQY